MNTQTIPPRLFVILARDTSVGVIFRRGPSRWVQLICWDTANDVFTQGQWFKGRIHEWGCNLSLNGEMLVTSSAEMGSRMVDCSFVT
jgi:hypothetical protein